MNQPSDPAPAPGFARFMLEAVIYYDSYQKWLLIDNPSFNFQISKVYIYTS